MHTTLVKLEKGLDESLRDLGLAETQQSLPGKWTIQQIVEHLVLTYASTEDVLAARVAKGRATRARPSPAQYLAQLFVTRLGYYPSGRPAPAPVVPGPSLHALAGGELAERALEQLRQLDVAIAEASHLFGERKRVVSHSILGPLSLQQWRRFHLVHGLHHLRQIAQTRAAMVR